MTWAYWAYNEYMKDYLVFDNRGVINWARKEELMNPWLKFDWECYCSATFRCKLTDWIEVKSIDISIPKYVDVVESINNIDVWGLYNWMFILNIIWVCLVILTLGLILPQKAKFIKFLNTTAAIFILIAIIIMPLSVSTKYGIDPLTDPQYSQAIKRTVTTFIPEADVSALFWSVNGYHYTNLFYAVASITTVVFLFGISDKLYSTENNKIEFLLLTLFIFLSSLLLLSFSDFICTLILLECITFSSYVLVGFERKNKFSSSSGIKYLILGSIPGGFFVLGVTLLYKTYGSFMFGNLDLCLTDMLEKTLQEFFWDDYDGRRDFDAWTNWYLPEYHYTPLVVFIAISLIFTNLLFKLTAAPLHSWAPSIYGGAPLATTTYLSIFSKLTIIFFSIFLYNKLFYDFKFMINILLVGCGLLSIIIGIFGAFSETLIKRFFVYSSMGHVGFMLLGMSSGEISMNSTINYLLIYIFSAYILWFILMFLTKKTVYLTNLRSLAVNHPVLSVILSLTMFSLSGIPPLAGFFVKLEIFSSVINSEQYWVLLFLFVLTVLSFFYYLRIIKIIYFENTKIFKKNKNTDEIKLRVIAILINILVFYIIFVPNSLLVIIDTCVNNLKIN